MKRLVVIFELGVRAFLVDEHHETSEKVSNNWACVLKHCCGEGKLRLKCNGCRYACRSLKCLLMRFNSITAL